MRLLRWNLANVTMACALIGAAIGSGWALRIPASYVSSAVIRIADGADVQNKHIRVVPLATAESGNWRYASTLQTSFQHPDRNRAQKFARALTEKFVAAAPAIKILDEASAAGPSSPLRVWRPQRRLSPSPTPYPISGTPPPS